MATRLSCVVVKRRVGDDHSKVGAGGRVGLEAERQMVVDMLRAEAETAEFAVALIRAGPEVQAFAARRPPDGIDDHERANAKAARGHGARGA